MKQIGKQRTFTSPKKGLKQQLKEYMDSITVDVLGYEKKITKNMNAYLEQVARQENLTLPLLKTRIQKVGVRLQVSLYHNGNAIKELTPEEITLFFASSTLYALPNLHQQITEKVCAYLQDFAQANDVAIEKLNVVICSSGKEISIEAFYGDELIKHIPITELTSYFI